MALYFARLAIHKVRLPPIFLSSTCPPSLIDSILLPASSRCSDRLFLPPFRFVLSPSPFFRLLFIDFTSFLFVAGPCGQGAFALLKLSSVLLDLSRTPDGLGVGSLSIEEGKVAALAIYACTIPWVLLLAGSLQN
jgi:hypothetical protein